MKILLIGHKPYVTWIAQGLVANDFLEYQSVDLIVVDQVRKNPRPTPSLGRRVRRYWSKLGRLKFHKIYLRFLLKKQQVNQSSIQSYFNLDDAVPMHENLKVFEYDRFFDQKFLKSYDLMWVASYGGKLRKKFYGAPRQGTWNIHPSALPELKGGYPTMIQVMHKEFSYGTTIHVMVDKIDAGAIIAQSRENNQGGLKNHQVFRRSARHAAQMLDELRLKNFKTNMLEQNGMAESSCTRIYRPEWFLGTYSSDTDLTGLVNAFSMPHLFPFIYGFSGLFLVQLLEVRKLEAPDNPEKKKGIHFYHLNDPDKATLVFHGVRYKLEAYIYKGKIRTCK